MKTCKTCGQTKEDSEFTRYKSGSKWYLKSWCKPCSAAYARARIKAQKEAAKPNITTVISDILSRKTLDIT